LGFRVLPLLTERLVSMPITKVNKSEILERCWEVFHREGYTNASLQALADASGLGKSGVLHHFGSKEGLMQAVLEYSVVAFEQYVLAPAHEDLPAEQKLEKLLRRQNRLAKRDRRGCFYANIGLETGREAVFSTTLNAAFELWKKTVSEILSTKYAPEQSKELAYQLLLQYEGAVLMYKISGDETHLEEMVRRAVAALKTGHL
jgi:TetR/AcrR family transcriptional regulator, transcriptional repressor for nem operon